jgi:spermidine synthase
VIPWILLETSPTPDPDKELRLLKHDTDYSIKIGRYELMNSRTHGSEDALGNLACENMTHLNEQHILIGGLGMGFTLRAALNNLKSIAAVTVAELLPVIVKWNRTYLSALADAPLDDKRVTVYEGDVANKINTMKNFYHGILMDVDNGPEGLTQNKNDSLYTNKGLKASYEALKPKGIFAVWSAHGDAAFTKRLEKTGFNVKEVRVSTSSGRKRGGQAVIWIAKK